MTYDLTLEGEAIQFTHPNWDPALELLEEVLVGRFMWMQELELEDGTGVHSYKDRWTRRYLHLGEDGRAFRYLGSGRYVEIPQSTAIREIFEDWDLIRPEATDEEKAALEVALSKARQEIT